MKQFVSASKIRCPYCKQIHMRDDVLSRFDLGDCITYRYVVCPSSTCGETFEIGISQVPHYTSPPVRS